MARVYVTGFALLVGCLLMPFPARGQHEEPSFKPPKEAKKYVAGRVLVRFRQGKLPQAKEAAHQAVGTRSVVSFRLVRDLELAELPPSMDVVVAIREYRKNPDVLYAEPDFIVYPDSVIPNDPLFPSNWGLRNTGQQNGVPGADIGVTSAWQMNTGSHSVVVGLLDTGIAYTHPDLAPNIYQERGINVVGDSTPDDPWDWIGHGTHVAGTIGAAGNNSLGVAGVNWQVSIVTCKFIGWGGGSTSGAIRCLDYMASLKDQGVNLVATNNSWGSPFYSQALYEAIRAQMERGILFVAAAGNNGVDNDVLPHYPAAFDLPNIISVAATDRRDRLATFSNFARRSVHVGAPGVAIVSTQGWDGYQTLNGTSMATPHVTGAAALLKAQQPSLDWIAIKNLLLAGGDTIPSLGETATRRRLNVNGAMTCANAPVLARQQPRTDMVTTTVDSPVMLSALHINCASPAGNVNATVQPGAAALTLVDDGAGPDLVAGDGIYSATWIPQQTGVFTLTLQNGDAISVHVLQPYKLAVTGYNYRTIAGTNLELEDDGTFPLDLPFSVHFGGQTFQRLYVSDNGLIALDSAFNFPIGMSLPHAETGALIAPFWDDWQPLFPTSNNVFWGVAGSAPNRELVIEWRDVWAYPGGFFQVGTGAETAKFQVVLFEDHDQILFHYADVYPRWPWWFDQGASASVGMQAGALEATQFSLGSPSLYDGLGISWQLADPDFVFSLDSSTRSAFPGQVTDFTGTVKALYGLNSTVSLSCMGSAPQICSGAAVTPSRKGTSFVVQTAETTPGTYGFQIQAQTLGGTLLTYTQAATLQVVDYALSAPSPATLAIPNAGSASVTFDLSAAGPVSLPITLTCAGLPAGATCSFPAVTISVTPGAPLATTARIQLPPKTPTGDYTVSILADSPGAPAPKAQSFLLTVQSNPDFLFDGAAPALRSVAGAPASGAITVEAQDGYAGMVSLTCSVAPAGPTCVISPGVVNVFPTVLDITALPNGAPAGNYQLTATGNDGSRTHTTSVAYHIVDYGMSPPASFLAYPTANNEVILGLARQNGYAGTVTISCDVTSMGPGANCFPNPSNVNFSVLNSVNVSVRMWIPPGTPGGTYSLAVQTQDSTGPPARQTIIPITVQGFTWARSSVVERTVVVGDSVAFDLTLTPYNGYNLPTTLMVWSPPASASFSFSPGDVITPAGAPVQVTMTITVPVLEELSLGGDYPVPVYAQADIPGRFGDRIWMPPDGDFNLHVQDFRLQASEEQFYLAPGQSAAITVTNKQYNALNVPVNLSCPAELPAGITCSLDRSTLNPEEVALFTFAADPTALAGFRALDLVGEAVVNGRTIRHKVTLTAAVGDFIVFLAPPSASVPAGGETFFIVHVETPYAVSFGKDADVTCNSPVAGVTCDGPIRMQVPGLTYVTVRTDDAVTPLGAHPFTVTIHSNDQSHSVNGTIIMQGPDSLILTAPNGYEVWGTGTQTITWHYTGNSGATVRLELWKRGVFDQVIAPSVPTGSGGKGFYQWTIPSMPFSQYGKIRIVSNDDPSIFDESDDRIWVGQGVEVVSPKAGSIIYVVPNSSIWVWYAWAALGRVRLELYKGGQVHRDLLLLDNGGFCEPHRPGCLGIVFPFLPLDVATGTDFSLRMIPLDDPTQAVFSEPFTISRTGLTVTSPNGGEVWAPGSQQTIAWVWTGDPVSPGTDVQVTLSGPGYAILARYPPLGANGSGSLTFTVPSNLPSSRFYKISVAANVFGSDDSDNYMAIGAFNRLDVTLNGSGWVTSSDFSISCGQGTGGCYNLYTPGSTVTLTAQNVGNYAFTGWSGPCTGTGTCTVTMSSDLTVVANFAVPTPDLSLSATPPSVTVRAGSPAQYTITVTPQNLSGNLTLSCSGLPLGAQCLFSPNNFPLVSGANSASLQISTTAQSAALIDSSAMQLASLAVWLPTLAVLLSFGPSPRRSRKNRLSPAIVLLLLALGVQTACGGGGTVTQPPRQNQGTPPGTYTVTIAAQAGTISRNTAVTLVVQ